MYAFAIFSKIVIFVYYYYLNALFLRHCNFEIKNFFKSVHYEILCMIYKRSFQSLRLQMF